MLAQDPTLLGRLPAGPVARIPCPYKGLTRYDVADAEFFVGRERLAEELVAALVDRRLVVVVGPSGAGKSSVVRAGLLARLAKAPSPGRTSGCPEWSCHFRNRWYGCEKRWPTIPTCLSSTRPRVRGPTRFPRRSARRSPTSSSTQATNTRVVVVLRADFYGGSPSTPRWLGWPDRQRCSSDLRRRRTCGGSSPSRLGSQVCPSTLRWPTRSWRRSPGTPACCPSCRPRSSGCGSTEKVTGSPLGATGPRRRGGGT